MKIRPVILCGGAGTRLWSQSKNNNAKQFIDFGGWSLLERTLDRVKGFGESSRALASTHPGKKNEVKCYADI